MMDTGKEDVTKWLTLESIKRAIRKADSWRCFLRFDISDPYN